jgi:hypothetical protein
MLGFVPSRKNHVLLMTALALVFLAPTSWCATVAYWRFDDITVSGSTTNLVADAAALKSAGNTTYDRIVTDEISGRQMLRSNVNGNAVYQGDQAGELFGSQVPNPDALDRSYLTIPNNTTFNSAGVNQRSLQFLLANNIVRQVTPFTATPTDDDSLDFGAGMAFTIEGWLKSSGTGSQVFLDNRNLSGDTDGYRLFLDASGYFSLIVDSSLGGSRVTYDDSVVNDNVWHHFAAVREAAGAMRLYVDGVEDTTLADNGSASNSGSVANAQPIAFGAAGNNTLNYAGFLDEIRISDVALTPDQFLNFVVPEPSIAVLLPVGALLLWRRSRR